MADKESEAEQAFMRVTSLDSTHYRAWKNLGFISMRLNKHVQASEALARAARALPDDAITQANLGLALSSTGKKEESIEPLRASLRLDSTLHESALLLGMTLLELRRFEEAVDPLLAAQRITPRDARCIAALGEAYAALGRREDALRQYALLLELDGKRAAALNAKIEAMGEGGEGEK
jgi:Flp pilus assembly protein TadD